MAEVRKRVIEDKYNTDKIKKSLNKINECIENIKAFSSFINQQTHRRNT